MSRPTNPPERRFSKALEAYRSAVLEADLAKRRAFKEGKAAGVPQRVAEHLMFDIDWSVRSGQTRRVRRGGAV